MANVSNLENKLLSLVAQDEPFAIAITGDWGIGKTRFWDSFKEKNQQHFKLRKYTYISLFGIDSLDSLKYEIAVKTHPIDQVEDRMKGAKSLFNIALETVDLPKIEGKGFAVNIGKSLITSTLSNLISKTVICIDDVERLSEKLDIKDVMGLINDLKLDKNCQVIVILHEAKADKQFQEYKEKVFDEVLILDDNLDILQSIIKDKVALYTMQEFNEKIGVKNLRFYNKVYNTYQYITDSIKSLSKTSKEHILKNLLIIRWIDEFQPEILSKDGKTPLKLTLDLFYEDSNNFISMSDDDFLRQNEDFKAFRSHISSFYPLFLFNDWAKHIINMLVNHEIPKDSITDLIRKDVLSESKTQQEVLYNQVMSEFYSLKLLPRFCERLYYLACTKINKSELNNLSFYCDILENCNRTDLAQSLESHVKNYIKRKINSSTTKPNVNDWFPFGREPYERFHDYIEDTVANYQASNIGTNDLSAMFIEFHNKNRSIWYPEHAIFFETIDKEKLKAIMWTDIEDERFRRQFIHSILLHPVVVEIEGKKEQLRKWMIELLNERMNEIPESKVPISMWLENTKNLTENLF